MRRICHLTTVHPRHDNRIFVKECSSLANAGFEVFLVVSDGRGAETKAGVHIVDAGPSSTRRTMRMTLSTLRTLRVALGLRAEIYHFHDPELIPAGLVLRCLGYRVIYDVHEDVARSLVNRPWLPAGWRGLVGGIMDLLERGAAHVFNGHMIVTPEIARRFPRERRTLLRNFPILAELRPASPVESRRRESLFGYVGTVSPDRGALVMVDAINHPTLAGCARLVIGGAVEPALAREIKARDSQGLVTLLGQLPRSEVAQTLLRLRAGLVLLQPVQAHMQAYPVKMFEYMAASVPVIASNYPVWKSLLDGGSLALCVDPTDPAQIAAAMKYVLEHPDQADDLARRADHMVRDRYNWETEQHRLTATYDHVLQNQVI